jgi:hypothetical protein
MSYVLQSLIGEEAVIRAAVPSGAVVVPLPQGKAMIPLSDHVREARGIPTLPLTDEDETPAAVPESIASIAEAIAKAGKVAYIEAELWGGGGIQACVTWDAAAQASYPLVNIGAINTALRFLGVQTANCRDEFDALQLGRYRETDDWEQLAEPSAL